MLEKVIELGNDLLNEELRQQLIDAFVACEQQLEVKSKAMTYLLLKYGINVDQMVSHKVTAPAESASAGEEGSVGLEDDQAILVEESPSPNKKKGQGLPSSRVAGKDL